MSVLLESSPLDALRVLSLRCLEETRLALDAAVALQRSLSRTTALDEAAVSSKTSALRAWLAVYDSLVAFDHEIWSPFAAETAGKCLRNASLAFAISGAGKVKAISDSGIAEAGSSLTEQEKMALRSLATNGLRHGGDLQALGEICREASEAYSRMGAR